MRHLLRIAVAAAAACSDLPDATSELEAELSATDAPGGYDAVAYDLRARFDWAARRIAASQDITVEIARGTTRIELDARVEISRVHARGRDLEYTTDAERGKVAVDLAPLLRRRDREVRTMPSTSGTSRARSAPRSPPNRHCGTPSWPPPNRSMRSSRPWPRPSRIRSRPAADERGVQVRRT
jgi:hypothetical protein